MLLLGQGEHWTPLPWEAVETVPDLARAGLGEDRRSTGHTRGARHPRCAPEAVPQAKCGPVGGSAPRGCGVVDLDRSRPEKAVGPTERRFEFAPWAALHRQPTSVLVSRTVTRRDKQAPLDVRAQSALDSLAAAEARLPTEAVRSVIAALRTAWTPGFFSSRPEETTITGEQDDLHAWADQLESLEAYLQATHVVRDLLHEAVSGRLKAEKIAAEARESERLARIDLQTTLDQEAKRIEDESARVVGQLKDRVASLEERLDAQLHVSQTYLHALEGLRGMSGQQHSPPGED